MDAPGRRVSLRSGNRAVETTGRLERSRAAAWLNEIGDSGRAAPRDERLAVALAQSHDNLAKASVRFEQSQERSTRLLGGLREWLDSFTGTARPEDINPIAAMLPDEGLESEVVGLMTDCQVNKDVSAARHTSLQQVQNMAEDEYEVDNCVQRCDVLCLYTAWYGE